MAGFSTYTERSPNGEGVMVYKDDKRIFLDKVECGMLVSHIQQARKNYWRRFRLPVMKKVEPGE